MIERRITMSTQPQWATIEKQQLAELQKAFPCYQGTCYEKVPLWHFYLLFWQEMGG